MKQKLEIFYILKIKNPLKKRGGDEENQIMIKDQRYCNINFFACQYLKRLKRIYICYSKQSSRKIEIVHRFFA